MTLVAELALTVLPFVLVIGGLALVSIRAKRAAANGRPWSVGVMLAALATVFGLVMVVLLVVPAVIS